MVCHALEEITIPLQFKRILLQYPDRPAMVYCDQVWSYQQLDAELRQLEKGLLALGIQKGDVVGIWCETSPITIKLMYAVTRIGAIAAMVNTSLQKHELEDILLRSDVRYLLIGDGYKDLDYPQLCREVEKPATLKTIFYCGDQLRQEFPALDTILSKASSISDETLEAAEQSVRPSDYAFMLYTSGTTSKSKIVLDTHYSRMNLGIQQAQDLDATCEDRFCAAMPAFHCFCISVNIMAALAVGGCLFLPENRRTLTLMRAFDQGHCTILSCVPALFHALLSRPDFDQFDLSSLRTGFIGGSLYPLELFLDIENRMRMTLLSSLGQTEACAGLTTTTAADSLEVRAHTVGHFLHHVEGKIIDLTDGHTLEPGQNGEICIRGYIVMPGYYKEPALTAETIDKDGFLHTGDMGYLDRDGNLHLTGRKKDLIIRGGENISPAEIETVVSKDPRVSDCRAIGVPDSHYGEEVCLCIIPVEGTSLREEELREMLAAQLAYYKVPKYICFLSEFPRTSTGKIRTGDLKAVVQKNLSI